ncbi:MAG: putative prefoldin subunit 3 [Monoraphidium minutum]|nr:MAG: putative prefoldin subunit 3 [Monoraphidium minutum]
MAGESSSGRSAEIAKSVFIDDVDAYMQGKQVEDVLVELQERLRRLRGYETQVLTTRKRLLEKLPEIKKSLEAVGALLAKRGSGDVIDADFELTDGMYAKAHLQDVENVGLWLGAGVMCEYPLEEAAAMLGANMSTCEASLAAATDNLGLLKDSITVTEVNTARVFNWDVEQRRGRKGGGR